MKKYLLIALSGCVLFLMSCGGDKESEPNPSDLIQKTWILDSYTFESLPAGFSYYEGYEDTGFYGESSYKLVFEDGTYTRTFSFSSGDEAEDGEWSIVDNELNLDPTGTGLGNALGLARIFELVTNDGEDLVLKSEERDFLLTDAWRDYVNDNFTTQEELTAYLNSLTEEQSDSLDNAVIKLVNFTVTYDFDLSPN